MSNRDIDVKKNEFLINRIAKSDTLSEFVDKCNANFDALFEMGGGPTGDKGDKGDIGNPTKPKVPIHVWVDPYDYEDENENDFKINTIHADLSESKYQEGHLIMLQNGHVYILKIQPDTFELAPEFVFAMQTYNPGDVIDGKNAYLHIAYSNSYDGNEGFITNQQLNANKPSTTFNLKRSGGDDNSIENSYAYIGVYSDSEQSPSLNPSYYTWIRIQGQAGLPGVDGNSAMHLELSQDYIALPSNSNGIGVHVDYNEQIKSKMILYDGDKIIDDYDNIEYSFRVNDLDVDGGISTIGYGEFEISKDFIEGDTNIECIATYNGNSFYKNLFIDLEQTPFELEVNKNVLTRDVNLGKIKETELKVRVKFWGWNTDDNGNRKGQWIYTDYGYIEATTPNSETPIRQEEEKDEIIDHIRTIYIEDSTISTDNDITEVRISYYDTRISKEELSYETIGIIDSGKNGENGIDGVTKFKSTVFARYNGTPESPIGGDFVNPNPENSTIWSDGIPDGNDPIWVSTRWFSNEEGFVSEWSAPVLMCDTPDFEVIYSSLDDITDCNPKNAPAFYKDADSDGGIKGWLTDANFEGKWSDDGGTNSIWMATINKTNGKWGNWTISKIKGERGSAPSCVAVEILGYSLDELDINSDKWAKSLNDLSSDSESISIGQKIYILNEYTWSDGNKTKGITVTLAGTQGVSGKSRVLFYLGSFQDGTLVGTKVPGVLNDERCDYYIDSGGTAWMRIGDEGTQDGSSRGNNGSSYWKESTKVGFLQTGAIHADMINTKTITAKSTLVETLFAQDVTAEKLKVKAANITGNLTASQIDATDLTVDAANITGTLTASQINTDDLTVDAANITGTLTASQINTADLKVSAANIEGTLTAGQINTSNLKVSAANIEGTLTASQINTADLTVDAANITGILTAEQIDATNLTVEQLNTNPNSENKSTVNIADNKISVLNSNNHLICSFSDDENELSANNVFCNTTGTKNYSNNWDTERFNLIYFPYASIQSYNTNTTTHAYPEVLLANFTSPGQYVKFTLNVTVSLDFTEFIGNTTTIGVAIEPIIAIATPSGGTVTLRYDTSNTSSSTVTYTTVGYNSTNKTITKKLSKTLSYSSGKIGEYKFTIGFDTKVYVNNNLKRSGEVPSVISDSSVKVDFGDENVICSSTICGGGILLKNNTNGILFNNDLILLKHGKFAIKIDSSGIKYANSLPTNATDLVTGNYWKSLI